MSVTFGSACSGIEASSVAWHALGWRAAWFSEIEPFPSSVLAHRYPTVPNLGDMTKLARRVLAREIEAPDVLIGGTPCQTFSVAGLRQSLDDERGNLTLKFVELLNAIDHVRRLDGKPPCIVVWENVPGVLSTRDNAFGCFLAGLAGEDEPLVAPGKRWSNAGCVYGPERAIAWRTLDAQYFGLAQRRRRVFVIASARNGFDPATVLFEWDGVRRDTAPSRGAPQDVAGTIAASLGGSDENDAADGRLVAGTLDAALGRSRGAGTPVGSLVASTGDVSHCLNAGGMGRQDFETETLIVRPTAYSTSGAGYWRDGIGALRARSQDSHENLALGAFGFNSRQDPDAWLERSGPLDCASPQTQAVCAAGVRRLLPVECERLMGFPDGYTFVPGWNGWRAMDASETPESCRAEGLEVRQTKKGKWRVKDVDGPRYKALGNSMAMTCMRWLGRRINR